MCSLFLQSFIMERCTLYGPRINPRGAIYLSVSADASFFELPQGGGHGRSQHLHLSVLLTFTSSSSLTLASFLSLLHTPTL